MLAELADEKRALRRQLRAALATLPAATKRAGGAAVAQHLAGHLPHVGGAVAFFASTDDEIDTRPLDELLRARDLPRALPRIDGGRLRFHLVRGAAHDLARDRFGIPTPGPSDEEVDLGGVALVVVPGLGFDSVGGRIGYGKGYYDRALAGVDRDRVVGVFLDEQRVERVPMGPLDVRLLRLCTPLLGVVDVDKPPPSL